MSFFKNSYSTFAPLGSIASYIGTTDPSGWILCDGVNRTAIDSRYNSLATFLNNVYGISTNTANSITPPNLRGKFLYSAAVTTTGIGQTGGSTTNTITLATMPGHTHVVSGTTAATNIDHTHASGLNAASGPGGSGYTEAFQGNGGGAVNTGITSAGANHSHTFSGTTDATGSANAFSIIPPYTYVNYIIKY